MGRNCLHVGKEQIGSQQVDEGIENAEMNARPATAVPPRRHSAAPRSACRTSRGAAETARRHHVNPTMHTCERSRKANRPARSCCSVRRFGETPARTPLASVPTTPPSKLEADLDHDRQNDRPHRRPRTAGDIAGWPRQQSVRQEGVSPAKTGSTYHWKFILARGAQPTCVAERAFICWRAILY